MENNLQEVKDKILRILRIKGPSLPVHIARTIGLDTLFSSAILSELASEKTIRISNLKVGGSPLYFLPGQETSLENFSNYLPGKEKEAFILLKQKKLLKDQNQEPAIRVALRNLRDFAFPLIMNTERGKELFWRFYTVKEKEAKEKIKTPAGKVRLKEHMKEKALLALKPLPKKSRKPKEKSDFVEKIISVLQSENIEIIEEKEQKKREYLAIIKVNSDIGKLPLVLIAKNKKRVTENDLTLALQKSQVLKMPTLFMTGGELSKKAQAYLEQYSGLIKFRKI